MSKLLIVLNLPNKISGAEPISKRRPAANRNFFDAIALFQLLFGWFTSAVSFVTVKLSFGCQKVQADPVIVFAVCALLGVPLLYFCTACTLKTVAFPAVLLLQCDIEVEEF